MSGTVEPYPVLMERGDAWTPARFWDYAWVESPEMENCLRPRGFVRSARTRIVDESQYPELRSLAEKFSMEDLR